MTTVEFLPVHQIRRPIDLRLAGSAGTSLDGSARIALVAAAVSVPPVALLHLEATGPVEPVSWTISDYVVSLPNGILLFGLTAAALAIGAGALVRGLGSFAGTLRLRLVLGMWAVAAVLTAVFPTNERGTPENLSSQIHLYAGAVAFAALPVAGWMLYRWQRRQAGPETWTRVLGVVSIVSGALSTALIVNRFPGEIGMPELMLPPGILQRAAGAVEIVLLAVAALAVLRSANRSRPGRPGHRGQQSIAW